MTGALDPEGAFVGAVLHLPAGAAAAALDRVDAGDLADPRLAVILRAATTLARAGIPPDPVSVMALMRADGSVSGEHATHGLTDLLHEAYATCPVPASVTWYAAAVLDEALRRRTVELADRIRQASTGPLSTLVDLVATEAAAVAELRARRAAITEQVLTR
jgi:replicative DNA helicase